MAFSVNTWVSANGDWGNVNSWSQGAVPGANDVVVFNDTSQQSVTAGLAPAGSFAQMLVKTRYRGNIGFVGSPLHVRMDGGGILVYRGAGQAYVNPHTADEISVVCDAVQLPGRDNLTLGGMGTGEPGYIHLIGVKAGRCRIIGDVAVGVCIYVLGDRAYLVSDANLAALQDPVRIVCAAGYYENHRSIVNTSKTIVCGDRSTLVQIGALPTNSHVVVIGNGKFAYLPISAPGTNPTLSLIGGVLDQSEEKFDASWGTVYIGVDAYVRGGTVRGSGAWPPDLDFGDEYPGAEE